VAAVAAAAVVTRMMAIYPPQNIRSFGHIKFLRLEYENTIHLGTESFIKRVRGVLIAIASLEGYTLVSVSESLK
jgi:hypothetical protein